MAASAMGEMSTDGVPAESPAQAVGFLLWQVGNLWQKRQRSALAAFGLTPVQYLLLTGVAALAATARGPVKQAAVARYCRTDPMMTSQVLRTLEKDRLITRAAHGGDARAVALSPTRKGRLIAAEAVARVREADDLFFRNLGADVPAFGDALLLLTGERPRRRMKALVG